jgi:hypothetical protein
LGSIEIVRPIGLGGRGGGIGDRRSRVVVGRGFAVGEEAAEWVVDGGAVERVGEEGGIGLEEVEVEAEASGIFGGMLGVVVDGLEGNCLGRTGLDGERVAGSVVERAWDRVRRKRTVD